MNEWHRIDGPTQDDPHAGGASDDARGDHMWRSFYGCGLARAEIIHYLAAHDIMADWGNDDDPEGTRVAIMTTTHTYVVRYSHVLGEYEHDYEGPEDYDYELVGLFDYELSDAERAHRDLDECGAVDLSWAFCGPDSKSPDVYARNPQVVAWNEAMKSEDPLDTAVTAG